ncbi:transcriptional regulator [Opitutia bacterium ISCC 51]|nr:transcriptional regulator [Opitutae bacterium ISCC 51]QXD29487.1 transcriptional regulator [Opitutae bacterium ISCC 52]
MASQPQPKPKARDEILHLLKTAGPQDSNSLAQKLGISAMAVRQHLYSFQKRGWVDFKEQSKPIGRPAKIWMLTEVAEQFFPDRHNDLLLNFIAGIEETLGKDKLDKVLDHRANQQVRDYKAQLDSKEDLKSKVKQLAQFRSSEGYMAEFKETETGQFLLIENHCPICRAAQNCTGLCDSELKVFQKSLGESSKVERIEHLLSGERRCVYKIEAS